MTIRLAREADADAISALSRSLTRKSISHEFTPAARRALDEALAADQVVANMRGDCRYHVYEEDGGIVGLVATRANRHLLKLFVAETAQGRGLARALWNAARAACVAAGHDGPFTVSAARGAVPTYQRLGFVASGAETDEGGVVRVPMHTPS